MAISMAAAMLGSAGISAIGSLIGGNSQRDAARDASRMTLQDNRENREFLTGIRNENVGFLSPFLNAGQTATQSALGLLNLGGDPAASRSAFDAYRGSTGYDFRLGEGTRALQSAFSRNLESGAASKAAIRYGQGIASDEFSNYYNRVMGLSNQGLAAGSALAGVNANFGNQVVAGNQSATSAAANARLYAGQANANMWQNLGSSFGNALGVFAGGGFGGGSGSRGGYPGGFNPFAFGTPMQLMGG